MSMTKKDFEAIAKMINDNIILVGEGEAKGKILTVYEFRVMDNKKVD